MTMESSFIDRQAAIDALDGNVIVTSKESAQAVMDYIRGCADRIRSLPSAQPELIAQGAYVRGFEQGKTQGMINAKMQLTQPDCTAEVSKKVDLIDIQAAIDALKTCQIYLFDTHDPDKKISLESAEYEIEQLPSAQQWIPCSERLPEDYTDVLAWFEYFRYGNYNCLYQTYGIGSYSMEYDSWMINHETGWHKLRVIAWMPLPEPWKGEQP